MSFISKRLQTGQSVSLSDLTQAQQSWIADSFTKICCRVDSEEELLDVYMKAIEAGLETHLITDNGRTEFHGQPTKTCLAIGPDEAEKIDQITGHLQLL